ncbi:MAG: oligosaccharide flippase family protein [Acidobacteria bacterium]|nr:oligosaccharide flippase family protein [Acidobacteriota bacterium]
MDPRKSASSRIDVPTLQKQASWYFLARFIAFSLSVLTPIIIVRTLTIEHFGVYKQASTLITTLASVLPFGVGISAFYFLSRDDSERSPAVLNIVLYFTFIGLSTIAVFGFFPEAVRVFFDSDETVSLSALIGGLSAVVLFSLFLDYVAFANREPVIGAYFVIASQITRTLAVIIAAVAFGTVLSILVASIIQAAIQSVVLLVYLGDRFPRFWRSFDAAFLKRHIAYALPLGFSGLLWNAHANLHFFVVGNRFNTAAFAIYAVGCFQLPLIGMLSESVNSVLIPRMTELQSADDRSSMVELLARASSKLAIVYLPIFAFFFITAETVITLLFTEAYVASTPIFRVFLFLIPLGIVMSDSVVRVYTDLASFLLKVRIGSTIILTIGLIAAAGTESLLAIVLTMVAIRYGEALIAEYGIFTRLGFRRTDLPKFARVLRLVIASGAAAICCAAVYFTTRARVPQMLAGLLHESYGNTAGQLVQSLSMLAVLSVAGIAFAIPYLLLCIRYAGLEEDEVRLLTNLKARAFGFVGRRK